MGYFVIMLVGSMAGFLPVLPMMAVFHFVMVKQDKKHHTKTALLHIAGVYIFCYALMCVLTVTGIPSIYHFSFHFIKMNLIPFDHIFTSFHEYVLNVILFIPIGILLPMLWKKFEKWHVTLLWGFCFSLSIEIVQLFNNRINDIDDLLMNTMGTIIGYFLFMLLKRSLPKISVFSVDSANHWKWEPYACFCFAWISILFISHFITSRIFGAARFI